MFLARIATATRNRWSPRASACAACAVCWLLLALSGCGGADSGPPVNPTGNVQVPDDDETLSVVDSALDAACTRRLNTKDHAAWQIVHGALAFGRDFQIEVPTDEPGKVEIVSAVDYALSGRPMNGWNFQRGAPDPESGRTGLRAILEAGSKTGQGHSDQWLGYLSSCGLTPDQTIVVAGQTYNIEDLITQTELDVPRNVEREYSWTLMGLSVYRPSDYEWIASDGQWWSIERLVEIELEHELAASACGGTHRMVGLTMALNRHLADLKEWQEQGEGEWELEGVWKQVDDRVNQCIDDAHRNQNADGSFSSNYFQRGGVTRDLTQSLGTTGHVLEFLAYAMTDEQLREPWVRRAALHLSTLLESTKDVPLECGALYHGAHGLVLYRERVFGPREYTSSTRAATSQARKAE
jgi:hypothetical protein